MLAINFGLLILGFYLLYNTSKKAILSKNTLIVWIQKHRTFTKLVGTLLILFSFYQFIRTIGLGAGIFMGLALLMGVGSLLIILLPLNKEKKL